MFCNTSEMPPALTMRLSKPILPTGPPSHGIPNHGNPLFILPTTLPMRAKKCNANKSKRTVPVSMLCNELYEIFWDPYANHEILVLVLPSAFCRCCIQCIRSFHHSTCLALCIYLSGQPGLLSSRRRVCPTSDSEALALGVAVLVF